MRNSNTTQLTIIAPFTKLDVVVKSNKGNSYLMNNQRKDVHCYCKSRSCVIIAGNIRYCIPDNTVERDQRFMDIKVTQNYNKKIINGIKIYVGNKKIL